MGHQFDNYNLTLHYRSGKSNVNANTFSRIPWEESEMATQDPKAIKAVMSSCFLQPKSLSVAQGYVSYNSLAVKALLAADVVETPSKFSNEKCKAAQRADEAITKVIGYLQKKPDTEVDRKSLSSETCGMLRQKDKLVLKSDLPHRQLTS